MAQARTNQHPKVNSKGEQELKKAEERFEKFEAQVKTLTDVDELNKSPLVESEPQTKLSTREAEKADAPYIKPSRSISSKEIFDEKFRKQRDAAWKYVKCIVENNEIIGEKVQKWTKKFPGEPAYFWEIPVNTPIYLPLFLAEELSKCTYHRLVMQEQPQSIGDGATLTHTPVAKETRHRIDCRSIGFASGF